MLKGASLWYKDGEPIGQSTILYDDEEKTKEKRDTRNQIATQIQRKIAERGRERFFGQGRTRTSSRDKANKWLNGGQSNGQFF